MSGRANVTVNVDLSLFTADGSFGHVTGTMRLPCIPSVGDVVPFIHPEHGDAAELIGTVLVESIFRADYSPNPYLILSDVYVSTKNDAFRLSRFLEDRFNLFANIHNEDDLRAYMDQEGNLGR